MDTYATLQDVIALWRPLTSEESGRVSNLLPLVSDCLRQAAINAGRDLDGMIAEGRVLPNTAKAVTVDIVARIMRQNTTGEAMSQESQAAGGYSWSGTYAVPGGGIANAIMRNDLKRLGINAQRIEVHDLAARHHC